MRPTTPFLALASALALAACPSRPPPGECRADGDCAGTADAKVCVGGVCRQCRDDAQCGPGQTCKDNACAAKPECTDATAAQDCGEGRRCVAGRCAAAEGCSTDADCGSGRVCAQGVCRAAPAQAAACDVEPVYFGFDEAQLSSEARSALDRDWQCLRGKGAARVRAEGHTDERGTTEYNLALGNRRAAAVRKYLEGLGAPKGSLRAVSFGKERPADPGHDESAWAKNRRVELKVLP